MGPYLELHYRDKSDIGDKRSACEGLLSLSSLMSHHERSTNPVEEAQFCLNKAIDEIAAVWNALPAVADSPWLDTATDERLEADINAAFRAKDLPGALAAVEAWRRAWLALLRPADGWSGPCRYPGHSRWRSVHGVVVCAVCHPPARPDLVAEWLPRGGSRG